MLAIRLKRTGRSGHAQFRVVVQDSHVHPSRGKIVAYLGSYNPHTKAVILDKEAAKKYLDNGAQPSDRAAGLLKSEGVKLPSWVELSPARKSTTRNPEKRRSTRPAEPVVEAPVEEAPAEQASVANAEPAAEEPAESEAPVADEPAVEAESAPAEEAQAEASAEAEPVPSEEPAAEPPAEAV